MAKQLSRRSAHEYRYSTDTDTVHVLTKKIVEYQGCFAFPLSEIEPHT